MKLYTEETVIELLEKQRGYCTGEYLRAKGKLKIGTFMLAPSPPLPEGIEILSDKLYKEIERSIAGMCHNYLSTAMATDKVFAILSKLTNNDK